MHWILVAFLLEKNTALNIHLFIFGGKGIMWVLFPKTVCISSSEPWRKNWFLWKLRRLAGQAGLLCCSCFRFCLCTHWQCGLIAATSALSSVCEWGRTTWSDTVYRAVERFWRGLCPVNLTWPRRSWVSSGVLGGESEPQLFFFMLLIPRPTGTWAEQTIHLCKSFMSTRILFPEIGLELKFYLEASMV